MNARFIGTHISTFASLPEPGDIGIGAENYHGALMVNCPVCRRLHTVNFTDGQRMQWDFNVATLTLRPSYKSTYISPDGMQVCHWTLTVGAFEVYGDSGFTPG